MNRSKTIGALAVAVLTFAATHANASVVVHQNPPGPGHFDWTPGINQNGPNANWLDITLPASSQPGTASGLSSFGQEDFSGQASKILGVFAQTEIQIGNHPSLVWPSAFGELIPANPAPPDHGWSENPFIDVPPAFGTNFADGQEAYVGVRFDVGAGFQHGWIGVVKNGLHLDAFAWGYETEPGVPIPAGVPEPTTLALVALGAGPLLLRTRRSHR